MRYFFSLVFLFVASLRFLTACSCGDLPSLSLIDLQRRYVFIGVIVSDTQLVENEKYGLPTTSVGVFKPLRWYSKNRLNETLVTIRSDVGSTCGITLQTGDIYLLFSNGTISICSRYQKFSGDQLLQNSAAEVIDGWVKNSKDLQLLQAMKNLPANGLVDTFYARGLMVNGEPHGKWDFEDPDAIIDYPLGHEKLSNPIVQTNYYTYGELDSSQTYGDTYTYLSRYKQGVERGWQESYYNGSLSHEYYIDEHGVETLSYQYSNSVLFSKSELKDGLYIYYSYNGRTGKAEHIKEQRKDGSFWYTEYRENGKVYMQGRIVEEPVAWYTRSFFYLDNYTNIKGEQVVVKGTGHLIEWYNDSTMALDVFIKNGIFYGQLRSWWENGQLYQDVQFGEPEDNQVYQNSPIDAISSYYKGRFAEYKGAKLRYHQNGKLWSKSEFNRNTHTEQIYYFTENGLENGHSEIDYEVLEKR